MPRDPRIVSRALELVAVACAVIITVLTGWRMLGGQKAVQNASPEFVADWQSHLAGGHRFGRIDAPVTILEFADFECPVCGQFTRGALGAIRRQYPDDVAVVYRHWPLSYHRFAYPAARAAECAGRQGRFEQYHDLLFETQDSLGLLSWGELAKRAAVPDSILFSACTSQSNPVPAIDSGAKAAQLVGGTGTPVVVVNGWRLAGAPDSATLDRIVMQELEKRQ